VEGATHNTNFDGVCFYPKWSLPGYAAIFRHPNDELNYCYYLIPCGKEGWCGDVKVGGGKVGQEWLRTTVPKVQSKLCVLALSGAVN